VGGEGGSDGPGGGFAAGVVRNNSINDGSTEECAPETGAKVGRAGKTYFLGRGKAYYEV
jgi:hypothetical protein